MGGIYLNNKVLNEIPSWLYLKKRSSGLREPYEKGTGAKTM